MRYKQLFICRQSFYLKTGLNLPEGLKMPKFKNHIFLPIFFAVISSITLFNSCASVQSPTGGPRDTIQPAIVKEFPKNLNRNFVSKKIEIEFDEFIKLSNEFTEISISPALDYPPLFKAKKELLTIEFEKELEKNTTYTINFGKAIADVNESNILKNYTYVFSTGNEIDSLSISGKIINALTKEKVKDVTVFILPLSQDSLFGKKKASFYTSTDTSGNFKLSNLREDTYRIYALNEQGGGDRIYNNYNEEIGFVTEPLKLNKDTADLTLRLFKEVPGTFMVTDRKIDPDGKISMIFNKSIVKPEIKFLDPAELNTNKTVEFSNTLDSATIWLPEITFDSLKVQVNSDKQSLDTIILRRNKRDTYTKSLTIIDNLTGTKLKPGSDLTVRFSAPIQSIQESLITLLEDSVQVKGLQIVKSPENQRNYLIRYPWKLKKQYILSLKENAFTDIVNNKSKLYNRKFELDTEENYGSISIKLTVPDTSKTYIIQWLGEKNEVKRQDQIRKNTILNYTRYPTAKYLVRVIYDENSNGKWDTGNIKSKAQPEKSWTFEKIIALRPNWDLEETVTIPFPD